MKAFVFVLLGAAAVSVAGCNSKNADTVDNAEMNQPAPELNALANDAATDANAEAEALGTQEQQLNDSSANDSSDPTDEQEQNVSGM